MLLSVVILTHNNDDTVTSCLDSITFADEIIIVDDNSTDSTQESVNHWQHHNSRQTVRYVTHPLDNNFSVQRNFGLQHASGDWVLFIDADEVVPIDLGQEIRQIIQNSINACDGYYLNRYDIFLGKQLKHGETAHVKLLRLAKRRAGTWKGTVHEVWDIPGNKGLLKRALLHKRPISISEFLNRINWYSSIRAIELYNEKVKEPLVKLFFFPIGKFLNNYIIKGGFRDGFPGLAVAWIMSWHSLLVRIKLRLLWKNNGSSFFPLAKH